jgi:hypothetical protein
MFSRQKIDEPPTPFHFLKSKNDSEKDSEQESASDCESVFSARTSDDSKNESHLKHNWSAFNAQLGYHEALQKEADSREVIQQLELNGQHDHEGNSFPSGLLLSSPSSENKEDLIKEQKTNQQLNIVFFNDPLANKSVRTGSPLRFHLGYNPHLKQLNSFGEVEGTPPQSERDSVSEKSTVTMHVADSPRGSADSKERADRFKQLRQAHYNEFKVLKALRSTNTQEEDDNEDEDDFCGEQSNSIT